MRFRARFTLGAVLCAALTAQGADLSKGTPDLKSAGPMAFGPDGLLFVGDAQGAAIFAIDTGDRAADSAGGTIKVEAINEKVAALLGTDPREILINDLAVNPASGKAYLSVARGRGPTAAPAIVRVDRSGKLEVVSLEDVPFAKATLANPPSAGSTGAPAKKGASPRSQAITDLAFVDGRVFVAGLSNEEFSSRLVSIPYPFAAVNDGTSVEIYHGAHGRFETKSPVRTFAAYKIKGEPYLMAAYTCTPLVKFPVAALKPGSHFKGSTVAELGNRNVPLDMVVYQKGGKDYILLANNSRGVMKISTDGIADAPSISDHITDTAGLPYQKVTELKGVVQLDALDKDNALVLVEQPGGAMNLETVPLPVIAAGPLMLILAAALATGSPAEGPGPSIRWELDPSGHATGVSVVGLPPAALGRLRDPGWTADRWPGLFPVRFDGGARTHRDPSAMLGTYRIEGDALRFTPRFPFDPGKRYQAAFRPWVLPGGLGDVPETISVHVEPRPDRPPTVVTRVEPSGDRLPENLLKFYLHFSGPMGRGSAYSRVRLVGEDGRAVDRPFLPLAEELWDPTGTRLTLLIDPGRIKRGLKPREELGPVLEAGRSYTLEISPDWLDAEGDPLGAGFRKTFRAEAADEVQPDPKTWAIDRPAASTREPLTLTSPEPLDAALLESALTLVDARGEAVAGRAVVIAGEARWRFTPEVPWAEGDYQLLVEDDLEDRAGNSIRRPFEVDVQRDTPARPESSLVRLPIAIRPAAR